MPQVVERRRARRRTQSVRLYVRRPQEAVTPEDVQKSQQHSAKHGVMLRSLFKTQC